MGIRSSCLRRSRSTTPPPSSSAMSSPWEEGRPSTINHRKTFAFPSPLIHCVRASRSSSSPHGSDAAAFEVLTDDLIVEILSRVPAKSLCRFKCVSKSWLNLIDHPDHRKRLAQPLAGFFYNSTSESRFPRTALHFVNADGRSGRPLFYPSFAFLPDHRRLDLLDCCNGLLLCYWHDASTTRGDDSYVVCNPATEQWVALPDLDPSQAADCEVGTARLGFDPAVSSHFHVFLLLEDARRYVSGVYVYSSETGRWIHKEKGWDQDVRLVEPRSATVFLNGCLYFRTRRGWQQACLAAVDTKGGTWSSFNTPCDVYHGDHHGLIQRSHDHLNYLSLTIDDFLAELYLEVYTLEDFANKLWTLKHRIAVEDGVNNDNVFGGITQEYFDWIAIHPYRNLIFFVRGPEKKVSHYSIDRRRAWEIHTLKEGHPPYLPYVPLYSELESLHT